DQLVVLVDEEPRRRDARKQVASEDQLERLLLVVHGASTIAGALIRAAYRLATDGMPLPAMLRRGGSLTRRRPAGHTASLSPVGRRRLRAATPAAGSDSRNRAPSRSARLARPRAACAAGSRRTASPDRATCRTHRPTRARSAGRGTGPARGDGRTRTAGETPAGSAAAPGRRPRPCAGRSPPAAV